MVNRLIVIYLPMTAFYPVSIYRKIAWEYFRVAAGFTVDAFPFISFHYKLKTIKEF